MPSATEPADGTKDDEFGHDYSPETIAAVFHALEAVDADVSPELAWTVQATINAVKHIGHEFGCLTESEVLTALGPRNAPEVHDFTLRYRGQTLYPPFLFQPLTGGAGTTEVRPLLKDLKKIAAENGWCGSDVVLWMTTPTTWFADGGRPVDHLEEPARILAAFEDEAGGTW